VPDSDPQDVVGRARAGDEQAWTELYRAHAGRLRVWLTTLLRGDASTAEDLAAEAWLVAARRISDFVGGRDDFGGWLFGIARNLAHNDRRTRARRATSPVWAEGQDDAFWGTVDDVEGEVHGADTARRLLARLPPREAEVLACIDVVGLDVRATSAALGISPVAVRVARHRGLGRLRRALGVSADEPRTAAPAVARVQDV
jgi:RNA polymerase sigma-70 factor (ECF subfamily)